MTAGFQQAASSRCAAATGIVAVLFAVCSVATPASADQSSSRSVLVLYGERLELPAIAAVKAGLDAALRAEKAVDVYSEFLDVARFPAPAQRDELASHLKARYLGRTVDLVVTVAGSALTFALDRRAELFPGTPIVFCAVDRREIEGRELPPDVTGLPITFDFLGTLNLALQLQPETKEVVCIAGTAPFDRLWARECRKVLDGYRGTVRSRFLGEGSMEETLSLVHQLPKDDIVLYLSTQKDGRGESFVPMEVAGKVAQHSNVPVYGLATNQLAQGIVGGSLFDFGAHGEETGRLCKAILAGGRPEPGPLQPAAPNALLINWQALQRWQLPPGRIPSNATVRFRPPSVWEEHPWLVLGAIAATLTEGALIVALLRSLRRVRQTRSELRARLRFERLMATLAGTFVNTPPETVDHEIEAGLDQVLAAMKLDRCALLEFSAATGLRVTHQRHMRGATAAPLAGGPLNLPWFFGQMASGHAVILRDAVNDLPQEAVPEKALCQTLRIHSALAFPLEQHGALTRAILYASANREPRWPEDFVPQLRAIGQLFASALARKEAEELLRESEATLSQAALSADLGLWSWDLQSNTVWATAQARRMYDWAAAEITFPQFLDRLHPEDRPITENAIQAAVADGRDYHLEYRIVRQDGAARWIAARGRTIHNGAGQPLKMMGASFDVTERKEREAEVEGHRRELAHLGRVALMAEMGASLAHELNQPLTAIVSNAGAGQRFIDRGEVDLKELHELLQDIVSDGERAGRVIRGIRDMVKKGESTHGPVDLNQIVQEVVRLSKSDAVNRSCTVVTELDFDLPPVDADPVQLQQVLLNLVLNAFDAMRETPVHLRQVVLSTNAAAEGIVHIAIRDFGTGLPDTVRKRIFEPFFSTKKDGLGMGLSIARSIVDSFGGLLDARNAPGGGALFHFTLPASTNRCT